MHVSVHVIKMILETTQLLCSAWHMTDPEHCVYKPCYKLTHKNHPCAIWTRESIQNYKWLCELGIELCKEYTHRYGKIHKCQAYIYDLSLNIPKLPNIELTAFRQAMPDMYKDKNAVEAYRQYYFFDKLHLHSWNGRVNSRECPIGLLICINYLNRQ